MSESHNVIRFPGLDPKHQEAQTDDIPVDKMTSPMPALTQAQEKAMQVILSGMSFVLVGVKPTDSGADFFTAVDGEADDIVNALPHLDGVINRAVERKGWS